LQQLGITFFDLGVLAIVLISALLALGRGLVREVLSLASWIGAALVAIWFFATVQPMAREAIANTTVADLAALGVVFLVPLIALRIMAGVIADMVGASALRGVDRLGGFVFGAARGLAIVIVAYLAATSLIRPADEPEWMKDARLMPAIAVGAAMVRENLPERLRQRLEEHDEPVDPQPQTPHRGRAVLEGAQEVLVELHRLRVATGRTQRLGGEHLALHHGVDELGEAGAALDPGDDEVPGLDEAGLAAVRAGQWLGDGRVVAQEGRLEQAGLDDLTEQLEEDLRGIALLLDVGLRRERFEEVLPHPGRGLGGLGLRDRPGLDGET